MSRRGDAVHIRVDAVDAAQVGHGHALIRRRHLLVEHLPGVGDEALDGGAGLLLAGATGLLHATISRHSGSSTVDFFVSVSLEYECVTC